MIILGVNMTMSNYSKFILYAAEYMNLYPDTWHTHGIESMASYIERRDNTFTNKYYIRDEVSRLYASVACEQNKVIVTGSQSNG